MHPGSDLLRRSPDRSLDARLGAPAELAASAGQSAWTPPVSDQKDNKVTLLTFTRQGQTMSADVNVEPNQE